MNYFKCSLLSILTSMVSLSVIGQKNALLPYQNPKLDVATRVNDLLGRMTLEEKIGQMTQISTTEINTSLNPKNKAERFQPFLDKAKAAKFIREHKVGSFLAAFAVLPEQWYTFSYELQKVNMQENRLGIPIIYGNDHVHGANYVTGASIFPQPFNLGATFNNDFATQMGRITALETADLGQHWNFAPILDIGRNPYWPRQYETFGEDPLVCATMGKLYIQALQNEQAIGPYKIAATAKHFLGYSDPKSGWDRVPSIIPDQELREIFLPPFKAAVEAGVKTFMINSGEVNGVPVHASAKYLNGWLRKELGFDGVILTDWADILQLVGQHKVAHNEKEATKMALLAGIDMSMTATSVGFPKVTKELVEEGSLPIELIDNSVRRILRLKFELGLFENPYPRKDRFARIGAPAHKAVTLQAARESIVLLQNEKNLLPLHASKTKNILVVGPSAHSKRNITGAWTIEWGGAAEDRFPQTMETVFTALQKEFPNAKVDTVFTGAKFEGSTSKVFEAKAAKADVIIMAVGEEPYAEGYGNITDLTLPQDQLTLISTVQATKKPSVIVMLAGRPRVISSVSKGSEAIIFAGLPGNEGGKALAEIISGKTNPSAKLSISYPSAPGHNVPYNHKAHDKSTASWLFGHGLSYTKFEYSSLSLSDTIINRNKEIKATVTVKNTGSLVGKEAVLWYIKDEVRGLTPLNKALAHYEKAEFMPGESKTFSFAINPAKHLAYPDESGKQLLEEGFFELQVGSLKKRFYLRTGGKANVNANFNAEPYLQEEL